MTKNEAGSNSLITRRDFGKISVAAIGGVAFHTLRLEKLTEPPGQQVFEKEIAGSDKGMALTNIREFFTKERIHPDDWFTLNCAVIYHFRELVDRYKKLYPYSNDDEAAQRERPKVKLGSFIKTQLQKEQVYDSLTLLSQTGNARQHGIVLDKALAFVDSETYRKGGRPLQCIGAAVLCAGLNVPISPVNLSVCRTRFASGLLSDDGRERLKLTNTYVDNRWGFQFLKIRDIQEVLVGQIFLLYGDEETYNHVGVVIGRKTIDGDTALLVVDANKQNDGRISVSEVNRYNFRDVFESGNRPVVVIANPDTPLTVAIGT